MSPRALETRRLLTALAGFAALGSLAIAAPPRAAQGQALRVVVESRVDLDGWMSRLLDTDIDARELAFDELVARARWDRALGQALEAWSLDPQRPELAWTARMALRELERGGPRLHARGHAASPPSVADLLRQVELDALVPSTLLNQPLASQRVLSLCLPRWVPLPRGEQRRVYKLDFHPEGVVLTEFVGGPGEIRQQRYAAESAQALLEAHPHLRHEVPGLAGILAKPFGPGSRFQWGGQRELLRFGDGGANLPASASVPEAVTRRGILRLGVKCTPLVNDPGAVHLLGPGVGLMIEYREPLSPAEELGLERGDILIELGGEPLCAPEEISRVLREHVEGELEVKILDRYGLERTLTWKPRDPR